MVDSQCFCGEYKSRVVKRLALNHALSSRTDQFAEIRRCVVCGMMRTSPTPVTGVDAELYDRDDIAQDLIDNQQLWRRFSRRVLDRLRPFKASGKLLDVGCSIGLLVDEANRGGYQAEGVDLNPRAVRVGVEKFGLSLRCQAIDTIEKEKRFDAIVMNHTIEHIHDLRTFLGQCARLLKKDGVLLAVCPNAEGGVPRFLNLLNRKKFGKGADWVWYGYLPEEHVWQFGPKSIRRVFEDCGYDVLRVDARENMYWGATALPGFRYRVMNALWLAFERLGVGDNLAVVARVRVAND